MIESIERRRVLKGLAVAGGGIALVASGAGCPRKPPNFPEKLPLVLPEDHPLYGLHTTPPDKRHAYFTDDTWSNRGFDYYKANVIRPDTRAERPEDNVHKHRPNIAVSLNRQEVKVDFINHPPHPHEKGHWWSWIEVSGGPKNRHHVEIAEPAVGERMWGEHGVGFTVYLHLPEPLRGDLVRVRAYCVTHGLYVNYAPL
ncbi:MAG: hypothetical protein KC466_05735 [Myxococcales bacterium]|nr:hypothetical protein [Myxococcales bacterium]